MTLSGVLNIAKPRGITSRQVVDRACWAVRDKKAGHAGTLDPLAEGVLLVCLGATTRLIEYLQRQPKRYQGEFLLGRSSPSEDTELEVTVHADDPVPTREQLVAAVRRFVGPQLQRPSSYSAVKVAGKRAYDLARRGKDVVLDARPIEIYALELVEYDYPRLVLDVECSGGTYIRALGRDLAASLSTHAVMSGLVRTAIGSFTLSEACPYDTLGPESVERWLLPSRAAIASLPTVVVSEPQMDLLRHGRPLSIEPSVADAPEYAALDERGELVAIVVPRGDGTLQVTRNFVGV